jgi:hypothetical protein
MKFPMSGVAALAVMLAVSMPVNAGDSEPTGSARRTADEQETMRRVAMASQPVAAGAPVVVDGYYRAVGNDRRQGRFVTRLAKGGLAPKGNQLDDHGKRFIPTAWVWQAEADSVTRIHVGAACPKNGYWRADVPADIPGFSRHNANHVVTCHSATPMPKVDMGEPYDDSRVRWVWTGPLDHPRTDS